MSFIYYGVSVLSGFLTLFFSFKYKQANGANRRNSLNADLGSGKFSESIKHGALSIVWAVVTLIFGLATLLALNAAIQQPTLNTDAKLSALPSQTERPSISAAEQAAAPMVVTTGDAQLPLPGAGSSNNAASESTPDAAIRPVTSNSDSAESLPQPAPASDAASSAAILEKQSQ